jgi:tyrosyl-tRNA synthetase
LLPQDDWVRKLARSEATGSRCASSWGWTPRRPTSTSGHTVVLNKMRQLQDLGHHRDLPDRRLHQPDRRPVGRNSTRPPLTREQIKATPRPTTARPAWCWTRPRPRFATTASGATPLGARGMIQLAAKYTVARMMERNDFHDRFKAGTPISVHEFLYPLMQGYDSVALKSDLELGGTDQKFNLLMGRHLQQEYGQEPQCILTMPLLEGWTASRRCPSPRTTTSASPKTPTPCSPRCCRSATC